MRKGDRISFQGRAGTIVGFMPGGMVDIKLDGSKFVERKSPDRLTPLARQNSARRNPTERTPKRMIDPSWRSGQPLLVKQSGFAELLALRMLKDAYGQPIDEEGNLIPKTEDWVVLAYSEPIKARQALTAAEQEEKEETALAARIESAVPMAEASKAAIQREQAISARKEEVQHRRVAQAAKMKGLAGSLTDRIKGPGLGLFTRPDPPRLTRDQMSLTGNPVDGTAYYIAVDNSKDKKSRYVLIEDVEKAAVTEGVVVPANEASKLLVLREFFPLFIKQREAAGRQVYKTAEQAGLAARGRSAKGTSFEGRKGRDAAGKVEVRHERPSEGAFFTIETRAYKSIVGGEATTGGSIRHYWKETYSIAQEREKLSTMLMPFAFKEFVVTSMGTITEALVNGSNKLISPETAEMFVRSAGVFVRDMSEEESAWGVIVDPKKMVADGTLIRLSLQAKAESPFFSWVPSSTPARSTQERERLLAYPAQGVAESAYISAIGSLARITLKDHRTFMGIIVGVGNGQVHLELPSNEVLGVPFTDIRRGHQIPSGASSADKKTVEKFKTAASMLGELRGSYGRIRSLFVQAAEDRYKPKAKRKGVEVFRARLALQALASKLAVVHRWYDRLDQSARKFEEGGLEDRTAQFVLTKLGSSLDIFDENAPFRQALRLALDIGLIAPSHSDKLFVSSIAEGEDFAKFMHQRQMAYLASDPMVKKAFQLFDGKVNIFPSDPIAEAYGDITPEFKEQYLAVRAKAAGGDEKAAEHLNRMIRPILEEIKSDFTWVVAMALTDFYPELLASGLSRDEASQAVKELIVVAGVYMELRGTSLVGPIRERRGVKPQSVLETARLALIGAEADVLGGERGLANQNISIFVTYNPLLFQITRLFWPTRGQKEEHTSFGKGLLRHAALIKQIDDIGRYGEAMLLTQNAAIRSSDVLGVQHAIWEQISFSVSAVGKGGASLRDALLDKKGRHAIFRRLWAFGSTWRDAASEAQGFAEDPLGFLSNLKRSVDVSMVSTLELEHKGFGEPRVKPKSGVSFVLPGQIATATGVETYDLHPDSALKKVEEGRVTQAQMLNEIDEALKQIDRRLGSKMVVE